MKLAMNEHKTVPSRIAAAPALFVLMWATGFIVARLSAPHASPLWFLVVRFFLAGSLLFAIALLRKARFPAGRQAAHAAVAGALIHGGYLGPIYWAVAHGMPAGVSALIVGLQPLLTAFIASLMVGEIITPRHWLGLVVGILGVTLVIVPKLSLASTGGITPLTTLVNLAGTVAISLGTVYQKKFATGMDLASGGVWQYLGATIVVALGAATLETFRFDGSFNAWFALSWSVLVLSIGAISLLMLLIRHGDVARVSGLIFLVPAVSAAMAYVLFDESLTPVQILGMAVCAAAVLIVTRRAR